MSMKPPQVTGFPQKIEQRYKFVKELGRGAYGVVCSAWDKVSDRPVAIKKIQRLLEKQIFAKRALREIKLLWHFNGHENITPLLDIEVVDPIMYADVYIVQELMEADLHQIIRSGQPLTDEHYQYFMYQICRGLKYIHSANVLHRDLKPGNLLVNADCELKICDFGLARGLSDNPKGFLTEYVATRWYRAPEIMLSFKSYTKAVDMWSLGCIFAELLGRKPIFRGRDYVDQLNQILAVLGTPDAATLKSVGSLRAQLYIESLPESKGRSWESLYPNATKPALQFLEKIIRLDPNSRITVEQALSDSYLKVYHEPEDEPSHPTPFNFDFEKYETIGEMRTAITREIVRFKRNNAEKNKPPPVSLSRLKEAPQGFTAESVPKVSRDKDETLTGAADVDGELEIRERMDKK